MVDRAADRNVLAQQLPIEGKVIVDIGSGAGALVEWLNDQGAVAVGVECSPVMLGQRSAGRGPFVRAVGQQLPLSDGSVDAAIFFNSLHHVPVEHMDQALAEAARVVSAGGLVYVLEPVAQGPGYEVARLIDDEAEVRRQAQDALDRLADAGFSELVDGRYVSERRYRDFAAFESTMVGIDGSRSETLARRRDEVRAAFERNGRPTSDGVVFEHPKRYRAFVIEPG
jgi:ubiquinone/menaquinone biosynthesis C-methylase UbiE